MIDMGFSRDRGWRGSAMDPRQGFFYPEAGQADHQPEAQVSVGSN
jgi:hypothetical protein